MVGKILSSFGINDAGASINPIGNGHINKTYKVTTGKDSFILQKINKSVFTRPEIIANNLEYAREYLFNVDPEYIFTAPLRATDGQTLVYDDTGDPWRLYNYIEDTFTIDDVQTLDQAYEAATAFGRFGRLMKGCELSRFRPTIDRFHDLGLRYEQFQSALNSASSTVKAAAAEEIKKAIGFQKYVEQYKSIIASKTLVPGIFHNDTKINNVLFARNSNEAIAVIDLDTVMEGYFIYDLGDLVRTIVSPVSEEERDLDKIIVRGGFYIGIVDGYLSEMGDALSKNERALAPFAGIMMTYIMALRFLADYLRGNTYYHITYPDQNLVRAKNQLRLTELLELE